MTESKVQNKATESTKSEGKTATVTNETTTTKVNLVKPEKSAKVETEPIISEQVMSNVINAGKLKKKSAGAKIREIFAKALADGKITADVVKMLLSTDDTKKTLNIRYAFLKPVTKNPNDRKIGGHARYATTVIQIGDKKFWVTNDWYEK